MNRGLKRFLVENFYKNGQKKIPRLEIEETHIDDFIIINLISSKCSYNSLLLSLIRIYRDLR